MLDARGLSKAYAGVQALTGVDLDLQAGEVHVLFGENGAGKSTLIGLLAGLRAPTAGEIRLEGRPVQGLTPHRARELGIAAVLQEFSLVPELDVMDNLFLGRERLRAGRLDRAGMRSTAQALFTELGFEVALDGPVGALSRAHRQMVEIAKALLARPRVLILDEPTASLTDHEADRLMDMVRGLRAQGVAILYVSHRLREIRALADRITVLRNGRKIGTIPGAGVQESTLVEMMTGRRIDALFPPLPMQAPGACRLDVEGMRLAGGAASDVGLRVHAGEIVGIAGLVGCGKSEVGRALFGLEDWGAGRMRLNGREIVPGSPRQMLRERLCYFPSDRAGEGLALNRRVRENATMAALDLRSLARFGWLRRRAERAAALAAMRTLGLTPLDTERRVEAYSGGNRQKVMLGRGLLRGLDVYIFDEPTVGIDVGAKVEIYEHLLGLARSGAAVLLISSELPEVLNLSHRVLVMHAGRIVAHLEGEQKTEAQVLAAFFGKPHLTADEAEVA
ncbi:MAG: sugar ABC transporter ATP-binding protein [Xenophilus sp.]